MARHSFASVKRESRLKVAIVSTAALSMLVGIFALSRLLFGLLEDLGADTFGAGIPLSDLVFGRLLGFFAAVIFVLLIFSNALIAYAALFRSREMPPLVLAPMSVAEIFLGRFVECVSFSSWAAAFLGAPVLLAYGLAVGASPLFYLAAVLFFVPFVVIPAALGAIASLVGLRLVLQLHRRAAWLLALLLVAAGAIGGFVRGAAWQSGAAQPEDWRRWLGLLESARNPWLPSFWLSEGTLATANGAWGDALFYFLLLAANAALLLMVATRVAEQLFLPGWSALAGDDQLRQPAARRGGPLARLDGWLGWLPEPRRALWVKDLRIFWREPAQWSQFLIFFGVMALYIANAGGQRALAALGERWSSLGVLLNVVACLLILASLTTRFVYPLVSLEGRRFWILGLAPISLRSQVWQKYWLSVATCGFFTVGLALLTVWRLHLEPATAAVVVLAAAAATSALCGLAIGLGSLYANFQEENPSRVVSGLGGTLNFLLSGLYIALVTLALALALVGRHATFLAGAGLWLVIVPMALLVASALVATLLPMRLGIRHLENSDF